MTFVPPWEETFQQPGAARSTRPVGYALIFTPPAHRGIPSKSDLTSRSTDYWIGLPSPSIDSRWGMRVDLSRLSLQCFALISVGGALHLFRRRSRPTARRSRARRDRQVVALGSAGLVALILFPPWREVSALGARSLGHSPIVPLPEAVTNAVGGQWLGPTPLRALGSEVRLDLARLGLLAAAVALVTAAMTLAVRDRYRESDPEDASGALSSRAP